MSEHTTLDAPRREWIADLARSYRARLLAYATRRGLDAQEALDAVQDSFVTLLTWHGTEHVPREGDDGLKLLTTLLRHNAFNGRRKRRRHAGSHAFASAETIDAVTAEVRATQTEELAKLGDCIERMPVRQRDVLLSSIDDTPNGQVATRLGISTDHVRVLLHRARSHLRGCTHRDSSRARSGSSRPGAPSSPKSDDHP